MLNTNAAVIPSIPALAERPISWFTPRRYQPGNLGTWSGHLTFANDLIKALQPSLIVELGTQWGESYFTFCQSVAENNLSCACYAIDHWRGEPHAGFYEEEVYNDVAAYNAANYSTFSYLLRSSFDAARPQFEDASIDLLHIDGLHTYEAVRHDFENWLPKVKPGGVILLHDIMARHGNFGVWRLWEELKKQFHDTFDFHHSWGLGILRKPGGPRWSHPFLDMLFGANRETADSLRRYYVVYSSHLENTLHTRDIPGHVEHFQSGIYINRGGAYAENEAIWQTMIPGEWRELSFNLMEGTGDGVLRFCPSNGPCRVELGQVQLVADDTEEILWHSSGEGEIEVSGTMIELQGSAQSILISTGIRPVFLLPIPQVKQPVRLQVRVRISIDFLELYELLNGVLADFTKELQVAQSERLIIASELSKSQGELSRSHSEVSALQLKLDQVREEVRHWQEEQAVSIVAGQSPLEDVRLFLDQTAAVRQDLAVARLLLERTATLEQDLARTREELARRDGTLNGMLHSLSWKLTAPIRKLSETLRRAK